LSNGAFQEVDSASSDLGMLLWLCEMMTRDEWRSEGIKRKDTVIRLLTAVEILLQNPADHVDEVTGVVGQIGHEFAQFLNTSCHQHRALCRQRVHTHTHTNVTHTHTDNKKQYTSHSCKLVEMWCETRVDPLPSSHHLSLHDMAPPYLSELCRQTRNIEGRCQLHSATRSDLDVPRCRLSTYGRRAFSCAGPCSSMELFTWSFKEQYINYQTI